MKFFFIVFFFFLSCKNTSSLEKSAKIPLLKKVWIAETVPQPFKTKPAVHNIAPVLAGNLVVQGNKEQGVGAYDVLSGQKKWFFPLKNGVSGGLTVHKKSLFFGSAEGFMQALDVQKGRLLWKHYTGEILSSAPLWHKGVLFFAAPGKLYALNAKTGKELWTHTVRLFKSEFFVKDMASPQVQAPYVYFKPGEGSLRAVNISQGRKRWSRKLSLPNKTFASAGSVIRLGKMCLYTAAADEGLYCIHKKTGNILWQSPLASHGDILLSGSLLFYPSIDGQILALRQKTGKTKWKHKTKEKPAGGLVLYKNTLIYTTYSGNLYFLSKETGEEIASQTLVKNLSAKPLLYSLNSQLYLFSDFGWLYQLKLLF